MVLFIVGLFLGCCLGVVLIGLLAGSREGREAVLPEGEARHLSK